MLRHTSVSCLILAIMQNVWQLADENSPAFPNVLPDPSARVGFRAGGEGSSPDEVRQLDERSSLCSVRSLRI